MQNYGMLASDNTKYPKLDTTLKAQVPKACNCKDGDWSLCHLQILVLDAVGPLAHILETHQKGSLSNETTVEAVKQAMRFLDNASSAILAERRRHMVDYLNKDLHPLIEEEEHFQDARLSCSANISSG